MASNLKSSLKMNYPTEEEEFELMYEEEMEMLNDEGI